MTAAAMGLLLLTTVLVTTAFSTALAAQPAPPQPCPATATELCDFYFETYGDRIPTFQDIRVKPDSRIPDHSTAVKLIEKKDFTLTLNTGDGKFLQCGADDLTGDSPDNQFYLENSNVDTDLGPQLYARTYNQPKLAPYFENRCIVLPITSVAIAKYGTQTVNLNKGDENDLVPEHRRCIVFRTGPKNPCPSDTYPDPPTEVDNESYPEHDEPAEEPREVYKQPDPRPTYEDPKKPAYADPRPTYGKPKKPTHRKPKPRYAPKPVPHKQTDKAEYDHHDDMDYTQHETATDDHEYSYSPPPTYGKYNQHDDSDDQHDHWDSHHDHWDHHDDGSYHQSYSPPPCLVKSSPPPCRSPPPPCSPPPCRSPPPRSPPPCRSPPPKSPPPCRSPPPKSPPPCRSPSPCSPPPCKAPPKCKSNCPKNPLALCDFYFDGYKTVVPTFKISAPGVVSAKSLLHKVFDGYPRRPATIQVETCHAGSFLGCIPKTNKPLKDSFSGQFYFNRDKLSLNPFRSYAKEYFANRCVVLPLAKLQFPTETGTYTTINAGAPSPYSPPSRRCVVFKTKLA